MRRAVLFDLFNTVVPGGDDGDRDAVNDRMAAVLGVDPSAYRQAFIAASRERFTGKLGDLAGTVRTIARRVGGDPTDEQVERASALRRKLTEDLLAAASDRTLSTLDELRAAGWRIGLVSNVTSESPERFRESALPPYFDATAFSSELGVAKPDADIYRAACTGLKVSPEECVYVGDGADNELAAALALGMYVVRTTEHANSDPLWTGPTVASLAELPTHLSRLPSLPR